MVPQFSLRHLATINDATIKRKTFITTAVAQYLQGDQSLPKCPGANNKRKTRPPGSSITIDIINNVGNCRNMASTVPMIPATCITPKIHHQYLRFTPRP